MELSYEEKISHWKHGGIVGVMGYGGGVIGRYSDVPDKFPNVSHFHTVRVNHPSGWFYTSDVLRKLCDIWEAHGSGLTNFHGSTGDIILLGTKTDQLEPTFNDLTKLGFDLGGSGSVMRTPSAASGRRGANGPAIDTHGRCAMRSPTIIRMNCTARLSLTSSSSNSAAVPTIASLPLRAPTFP